MLVFTDHRHLLEIAKGLLGNGVDVISLEEEIASAAQESAAPRGPWISPAMVHVVGLASTAWVFSETAGAVRGGRGAPAETR